MNNYVIYYTEIKSLNDMYQRISKILDFDIRRMNVINGCHSEKSETRQSHQMEQCNHQKIFALNLSTD